MDEDDVWTKYREEKRKKKKENIKNSLRLLKREGIICKVLNEAGAHYRVAGFDFWPSTGKFYNQRTKEKGRGVFKLIKRINWGKGLTNKKPQ